ncbi:hypothetical protein [Bacteroides sp. 51]|uniref:hypothetical protein n=1 Tax=Bacteroides sp. 51 TaxID=2302938 RepID=UPI0013D691A9|nr:hypothetical protein [Bacteroides sp. 51]
METLSTLISWLISFIGIGVTVLIGVNLWTSLSIDKRIKMIVQKEVSELKKQNIELRKQLQAYSLAISESSSGYQYYRLGATADAFYCYANAVEYASKADDKNLLSEALDTCKEIMEKDPQCITENQHTLENLDAIRDIFVNVRDERAYDLYSYFVSLSTPDKNQSHEVSQQGEEIELDNKE